MNNKRHLSLPLVVAALLSLSACSDSSLSLPDDSHKSALTRSDNAQERMFVFPELQWETFQTHDEKVAANQIPATLLPDIPTDELVVICMEYPLLYDAYAYDSPLVGLKQVMKSFNGFGELLKREDNALCLVNYLKENWKDSSALSKMSMLEKGDHSLHYALAESVLSQDSIISRLDRSQLKSLASFALQAAEAKDADREHHGLLTISSSVNLCLHAILQRHQSPLMKSHNEWLEQFLTTGLLTDDNQLSTIKTICKSLIQSL